jgi:hypothetical protein
MRNQMITDKIQQGSHHMPMPMPLPCMRLFALTPARGGILLAFLEPWASLNASLAALFAPWPRAQATSPVTTQNLASHHPGKAPPPDQEQEHGIGGLAEWPGRIRLAAAHGAPPVPAPNSPNRIPYCCSYMERTCHQSAGPW